MTNKTEDLNQSQLKKNLPDIRPGDTVCVHQKTSEGEKTASVGRHKKTHIFEGVVIARKHGKGVSATITVRKMISGIGVEKIFPIHSPIIDKIEIVKRGKVRRAKLYYLRKVTGKKAKLKKGEFVELTVSEGIKEGIAPEEKSSEEIKEK